MKYLMFPRKCPKSMWKRFPDVVTMMLSLWRSPMPYRELYNNDSLHILINIGITYQYICCYRIASTWMGECLHSCLYFVWINLSKFTVRYIVWSGYSFHNIFHSDTLEMMNQLTWFGVVLSIHKVSCCLKYLRPTRINGWWTIVTALYNITTSVLTSEMVLAFLTTSMKPVLGPVAMQP